METIQNWAIIIMIVTLLVEIIVSHLHNLELFDIKDSLVNILFGVVTIVLAVIIRTATFGLFTAIHEISLFQLNATVLTGIILFIISDLHYYWFHRLAHLSSFFWAQHAIHHSSQKYNLTVGIRLPFTNGFYRFIYWSPLCFIGFDPLQVVFIDSLVVYYTFFLHTESIGKLGFLEKFMNTPSHHRVHHSTNPQYLDKNFGGVFIIWDKLFSTFTKEEEKPVYGLTNNFKSYHPVKIFMAEWEGIIKNCRSSYNIKQYLQSVFGRPGQKIKPTSPPEQRSGIKVSNANLVSHL